MTDGSVTTSGCGAGMVLTSPEGPVIKCALKFTFPTTNNEAEYEAIIAGMRLAIALEAKNVILLTDSQLAA